MEKTTFFLFFLAVVWLFFSISNALIYYRITINRVRKVRISSHPTIRQLYWLCVLYIGTAAIGLLLAIAGPISSMLIALFAFLYSRHHRTSTSTRSK